MPMLDSAVRIVKHITKKRHKPYIAMTNRWRNMMWFVKQGHLVAHAWDRLKWYGCPGFFITPSYPCHIELEASAACQMKCPMCAQGKMFEQGLAMGNMPMDLFKKIVDEVHNKVYSIKLSWRGEPSLNPNMHDMIRYAKLEKKMKSVAFLTNFERYDEAKIDDLLTTGVDYVSISFDGMKDTYERIRYPAKFEETIEKVKYFRRRRDELGLKLPVIRVQSIYSAIKDHAEEFLALWEPICDRVNFIADQYRADHDTDAYDLEPGYACPTPFNRMAIGWNGRVTQCYSDYGELTNYGDASKNSVYDIWHNEHFDKLRVSMKTGTRLDHHAPCRTCDHGAKNTTGEWITVQGRELPVRINAGKKIDPAEMDAKNNKWKRGQRQGKGNGVQEPAVSA
jgi:radical SAM protein with 4Fe4S-binding SPASM domain